MFTLFRSAIYSMYGSGPSTKPYGTPNGTSVQAVVGAHGYYYDLLVQDRLKSIQNSTTDSVWDAEMLDQYMMIDCIKCRTYIKESKQHDTSSVHALQMSKISLSTIISIEFLLWSLNG